MATENELIQQSEAEWKKQNKTKLKALGFYEVTSLTKAILAIGIITLIVMSYCAGYYVWNPDKFKPQMNSICATNVTCQATTCPVCPACNCNLMVNQTTLNMNQTTIHINQTIINSNVTTINNNYNVTNSS